METLEKLKILASAAKYDVCAATSCGSGSKSVSNPLPNVVCHSFLPDGRCVSLFKVLQTNACQKDCFYCANRVQRDIPRADFTPQELANLFMEFYRRNYVEGIFLSSGIRISASRTMEDLIKTAEILRFRFKFKGYIHLKILPGARFEYVERAVSLANRVSINIEAPTQNDLKKLSHLKNFQEEILTRMTWIKNLSKKLELPAGQSTQFIVGAAKEQDASILKTTTNLYANAGLKRVYFSAFQPVQGTPLESSDPTPVLREHRLYQSDFLLRNYEFNYDELYFDQMGNLPLELDPKMCFATKNIHLYPMEVNKVSYKDLLRVPGIGPTSARRIVKARQSFNFNSLAELKNVGVVVKRAAPFILINNKFRDSDRVFKQLELWSEADDCHPWQHPFGAAESSNVM